MPDHGIRRGRHLWDHIQNVAPLDADQALVLLRRLARGLAQAHARGVTHRDLSPDNVILRDNRVDEAVLIDFGIARSTELGDGLNGRFAGKFKYIAPEQLGHAGGEIGPPADVYGLALMIAAAMRGRPLDMGASIVEASEARRRIPDLSGISYRVYPLLQHMLEPDPRARPHDMDALLRILDDPNHLPARYRLPLWNMDHPTDADGTARGDGTGISLTPNDLTPAEALTDPASPFGASFAPPAADADQPTQPRNSRMRLYAGAALAALAVGGWAMFGQQTETPGPPRRSPGHGDGSAAGFPRRDAGRPARPRYRNARRFSGQPAPAGLFGGAAVFLGAERGQDRGSGGWAARSFDAAIGLCHGVFVQPGDCCDRNPHGPMPGAGFYRRPVGPRGRASGAVAGRRDDSQRRQCVGADPRFARAQPVAVRGVAKGGDLRSVIDRAAAGG
ncbi:protein kinase [Paracoccus sp. DMF-8]|uniref:serine/threonine-protein kinase n=1 Tax=Paracoccus sp. DMF-8 TaxID=3019445 RepID=UPI0023E88E4E|nr:protein kinase [Paracoccus sp. DMF-8]MDF3605061.1 protein kinase [Paracoccus sp. DMF-8]